MKLVSAHEIYILFWPFDALPLNKQCQLSVTQPEKAKSGHCFKAPEKINLKNTLTLATPAGLSETIVPRVCPASSINLKVHLLPYEIFNTS